MALELLQEPESRDTIEVVARTVFAGDMDVVLRYPNIEDTLAAATPGLKIEQNASTHSVVDNVSFPDQLAEASKEAKLIAWKGFRFCSQSEVRIAEELDRGKVLFFPNCKARLGFREREKREPDFLVYDEGKWGLLEVDGELHHPLTRTVEDHERDRLFRSHGILLVEHFDASEC